MLGQGFRFRTPNQPEGGKGTHIDAWKFVALQAAIRAHFAQTANQPLGFMALCKDLRAHVSPEDCQAMGSFNWFATTVILELEFRGELCAQRVKGKKMLCLAS